MRVRVTLVFKRSARHPVPWYRLSCYRPVESKSTELERYNLALIPESRLQSRLSAGGVELRPRSWLNVSYLAEFAKYASNGFGASQTKAPNYSDGEEYPPVRDASKVSDWERMLFPHLVRLGLRPVVQHPVERYELDFAIFDGDRKLNVEVDGQRYHADWDGELCYRDRLRNQRLIELGWSVMRFWVYELRDDLPRCLKQIEDWKAKSTPKAR